MFNVNLVIPQESQSPVTPSWSIVNFRFVCELTDYVDGEPKSLKVRTKLNQIEVKYVNENNQPFSFMLTSCKPISEKHLVRYGKELANRLGLA